MFKFYFVSALALVALIIAGCSGVTPIPTVTPTAISVPTAAAKPTVPPPTELIVMTHDFSYVD